MDTDLIETDVAFQRGSTCLWNSSCFEHIQIGQVPWPHLYPSSILVARAPGKSTQPELEEAKIITLPQGPLEPLALVKGKLGMAKEKLARTWYCGT